MCYTCEEEDTCVGRFSHVRRRMHVTCEEEDTVRRRIHVLDDARVCARMCVVRELTWVVWAAPV